ncbi:MAG: Abi family protein [Actinomycetaceae bacterium]|nr:Abi family protein [Actinomycetaceae bacterium]
MSEHNQEAVGQSNSPGGVSMFHDIDQSGALCSLDYHTPEVEASLGSLENWFSLSRLHRYAAAARPSLLYIWNTRLSKAFLEDVGHVEVLLRNFIHDRLTRDCGRPDWYHETNRYNLKLPFQKSLEKVEKRIEKRQGAAATPDQVIAELSFDNWRFLLTQKHEVNIWKALINLNNGGMPHYRSRNRADFESDVELIRQLRNRASHQEPLILEAAPTTAETEQLDAYAAALENTAARIDPDAAQWIIANSRVEAIRKHRP